MLLACASPLPTSPLVNLAAPDSGEKLGENWAAIVGPDRPVNFTGEYRGSGTSTRGPTPLYPGHDLATFLASILTHALIQNSVTNAEQQARLNQANSILEPFADILKTLTVQELFRTAVNKAAPSAIVQATNTQHVRPVDLVAQFTMAADKKAIYLDLIGRFKAIRAAPTEKDYLHFVRVISKPLDSSESQPDKFWNNNNGIALQTTAQELLNIGMTLFVADANGQYQHETDKQITAGYFLGTSRRFERATLLAKQCDRQTLRTLRGWILSVPVVATATTVGACPQPEAVQAGPILSDSPGY
ncbi:MAG: hypothetical protein WA888_24470 [Burkholderiaceae bacterium]